MFSLASATNGSTSGMQGISGHPAPNSTVSFGDLFYSLADYGFVPTMDTDMIIGEPNTNVTESARSDSALDFFGMTGSYYDESADHHAATAATATATATGNHGNHTAAVSREGNNKINRSNVVSSSSMVGVGTVGGMWEGRESSNCTYDNIFDDFLASDIMPQSQP